MMQELSYRVSFNTPAFLGNAEQDAQWRTPPFKALMRQWWRVAVAKELGYDFRRVREEEGLLFGHAWLESDTNNKGRSVAARKSSVRLRLSDWGLSTERDLPSSGKVHHPEVGKGGNGMDINADTYLGYGPVNAKKSYLKPIEDESELWIGARGVHSEKIADAMMLLSWFGCAGSRSRNGWGSVCLNSSAEKSLNQLTVNNLSSFMRPLESCLDLEWAHAIGSDSQGALVWKTKAFDNWRDAMRELARTKIAFRTASFFKFPNEKPSGHFYPRHLLSYPVTRHSVRNWGNNSRLGNQLRFKVIREESSYIGLIVHLPCRLPEALAQSLRSTPNELTIWQEVHKVLDDQDLTSLTRLR